MEIECKSEKKGKGIHAVNSPLGDPGLNPESLELVDPRSLCVTLQGTLDDRRINTG